MKEGESDDIFKGTMENTLTGTNTVAEIFQL